MNPRDERCLGPNNQSRRATGCCHERVDGLFAGIRCRSAHGSLGLPEYASLPEVFNELLESRVIEASIPLRLIREDGLYLLRPERVKSLQSRTLRALSARQERDNDPVERLVGTLELHSPSRQDLPVPTCGSALISHDPGRAGEGARELHPNHLIAALSREPLRSCKPCRLAMTNA